AGPGTLPGALDLFLAEAAVALKDETAFRAAAANFLSKLAPKGTAAIWEVCRGPKKHPELQRLWRLLRHLSPSERRSYIAERLCQSQRIQLEHWILSTRGGVSLPSGFSSRSLCRWKGRRAAVGYRPILHLHDSLYAQAAFTFNLRDALRALGVLLALRAALAHGETTPEKIQASLLAVLRSSDTAHKFYFKTRLKVGRREVATPLRQSLPLALREWRYAQLFRARSPRSRCEEPKGTLCLTLDGPRKRRASRRGEPRKRQKPSDCQTQLSSRCH
ncbi:unnamed protein product, partial [Effrenium voratum]